MMIIELTFAIVNGVNRNLEREHSWKIIDNLIKRYPDATWKRITDLKSGIGKYVVQID